MDPTSPTFGRFVVLVPTVATSFLLGMWGMPVVPRLVASLGVGLVLSVVVLLVRLRGRR